MAECSEGRSAFLFCDESTTEREGEREGGQRAQLYLLASHSHLAGGHDNVFVYNNGLIKVVLDWPCIEI